MPSRQDSAHLPVLHPATLAGLEGEGILTLTRNTEGRIVDSVGTCRFGPEIPLEPPAHQALRIGHKVVYRGAIADGELTEPKVERAKLNVLITSVHPSTYPEGKPCTVVEFTSHEHS